VRGDAGWILVTAGNADEIREKGELSSGRLVIARIRDESSLAIRNYIAVLAATEVAGDRQLAGIRLDAEDLIRDWTSSEPCNG
jgi:hypothetical protein